MRKLRVFADLMTPIAGLSPLPLDGIVIAVHRDVGQNPISASTPREHVKRISDLHHPSRFIAWFDDGSNHVPLCSAMLGEWTLDREDFTKRRDAVDVESLAGRVTRGTGPDRDKMLPLPLRVTTRVHWDVFGDRREILSLLRGVDSIGSHRRQGYGRVREWMCEVVDDCEPIIRDDVSQRAIPLAWCDVAERSEQGLVEPPYWYPSFRVERVPPFVRCNLRKDIRDAIDSIASTFFG